MKYARYLVPTLLVAAVIAIVLRQRADAPPLPPPPTVAAPVAAKPKSTAPRSFATQPPVGTKGYCPVSDEEYTVTDRTQFVNYGGRVYGFCCSDCKPDFEKNPLKFAEK